MVAGVATPKTGVLVLLTVNLGHRLRSYCSYAEQDAESVAAALASYFADPDHTATPEIDDLKATEQLSVNNDENATSVDIDK